MQLKVIKDFSWAHEHVRVVAYEKGQIIETDDADLIEVSLREKWAQKVKGAAAEQASATSEEKASEPVFGESEAASPGAAEE